VQLNEAELETAAAALGQVLRAAGERLVTAESCTGGWVAACVTAIAGSSDWFERGYVTYSNDAKQELLGVPGATLAMHGAVSGETAAAMAEGALRASRATVAVAITGVAGPAGGSVGKPVGTVWFGFARQSHGTHVHLCRFDGDRRAVRAQAVAFALAALVRWVDAGQPP
jgi:nicotinamide-nucleotide amidase